MKNYCSIHSKLIIALCFHQDCDLQLLCLKCFKEHSDDHETNIKELPILLEDNGWIEEYEKSTNDVLVNMTNLEQESKMFLAQSKTLIEDLFEEIKTSLETKKIALIEELENGFRTKFGVLSKSMQSVKDIGEDYLRNDSENFNEKLDKIRGISKRILPEANDILQLIKNFMKEQELNEAHMISYKEQILKNIKSPGLKEFVSKNPQAMESDIQKIQNLSEKIIGLENLRAADVAMNNSLREEIETLKEKYYLAQKISNDNENIINQILGLGNCNLNLPKNFVDGLSNSALTELAQFIERVSFQDLKKCQRKDLNNSQFLWFCSKNEEKHKTERTVWGSNPYTSDSGCCQAGIHSGIFQPLKNGTKFALIETTPGLGKYDGSIQNGVSTNSYGNYPSSYYFKKLN